MGAGQHKAPGGGPALGLERSLSGSRQAPQRRPDLFQGFSHGGQLRSEPQAISKATVNVNFKVLLEVRAGGDVGGSRREARLRGMEACAPLPTLPEAPGQLSGMLPQIAT